MVWAVDRWPLAGWLTPITMLGRKQSLRGDHILGDYGLEETLNESAEIEWANKVSDQEMLGVTATSFKALFLK